MAELLQDSPLVGDDQEVATPRPPHPKEMIEVGAYVPALNPDEKLNAQEQRQRILDEMAITGESPEGRATLAMELKKNNANALDALNRYVQDVNSTPEDVLAAAEAYKAVGSGPYDLATAFAKQNAVQDLSQTAEEQRAQDINVGYFAEQIEAERELAKLGQIDVYARDNIASRLGYTIDGAAVLVPFNWQSGIRDLKEAVGLESSIIDYVFFGSAMEEIKERYVTATDVERKAFVRDLHTLLQKQGFTGTNEFIGYQMTSELLDNLEANPFMETVNNVIGVLDIIGVGQATKGLFGGFKVAPKVHVPVKRESVSAVQEALGTKGKSLEAASAVLPRVPNASPLKVAVISNPRTGSYDVAQVIADPTGKLAETMGTNRMTAITEWILPKAHIADSPITAQPGNVSDEVARVRNELTQAIDDTRTHVLMNYTEEELKGSGVSALKRFGKIFKSVTNVPSSKITFTDTGIELNARLQANDISGWTSLEKVKDYIDTVFGPKGGELLGLRIERKNPKTGQWSDISKQLGLRQNQGDGEYSILVDLKLDADPSIKEAFGPDAISAGLGRFTKYVTNPQALFSRQIVDPATLAKDKSARAQHTFLNTLADNFNNLRRKAKDDWEPVMMAIRQGAKDEVWYTPDELRLKFGVKSNTAIDSYQVFKEIQDGLFVLGNKVEYRRLKGEGFKSLYIDEKYSGFNVKAIPEGEKALIGKQVYVPSTERVVLIRNKEELQNLIDEGYQFGRLRSPYRVGHDEFNYVAAPAREGANFDALTYYPVPYRKGHYFRSYENANYVVQVKNDPRRHVDGIKTPGGSEVLGVARTRQEAEIIQKQIINEELAKVEAEGLDVAANAREFEIITDQFWHSGKPVADTNWDMISASAMNLNRHRGEWLRGIEDLATVDDPLEATAKQIASTMDKATKTEWIEAQQSAWIKSFGEALFGKDSALAGTWPRTTAELVEAVKKVSNLNPQLTSVGKKAIQHYEYVEMIRGMPSKLDDWWRSWALSMADKASTQAGQKAWQWIGKKQLEEESKKVAFKLLLGLHPFKQVLLQPSQMLQLSFIEPAYMFNFAKGGLVREMTSLTNYSSMRALGLEERANKMFPKGKELWDEFSKTGLGDAVAHHVYLNPGNAGVSLQKNIMSPGGVNLTRRARNKAWALPSEVGFEAGERANVMMHWLVARKRWMDRNPGKDWKGGLARDQIHAEQRAISLNPTAAGRMGYQDWGTMVGGIASLLMQFFSHGHKTMMSVLPTKIGGSRVFTASEKAKIAAANVTFFGTAAIPFFNDAMDEVADVAGWDIDPELWKNIKHGYTDVAMNRMLSVISGEEQDIRFSTTFNPTSGIQHSWDNFLKYVTRESRYRPDLFAASGVYSSLARAAGTIATIWNEPDTYTNEKLIRSVHRIAEIAPGYSAATKARIAKNTGLLMSQTGRAIARDTTALESLFVGLGFTLGEQEDYYDALDRLSDITYKGSEAQLREDAKVTMRHYMEIYKTSDRDVFDIINDMMTDMTIIFRDPRDRDIVMDELANQTDKYLQTGKENLLTLAAKASVAGDKEELNEILRNAPPGYMPEEARNALQFGYGAKQ